MRRTVIAALALPVVARAQSETIEYYGTDVIGSIRIVWDANGNVLARQDYGPFGKPLVPVAQLPKQGFGGQETDGETDQAYFHARNFTARIGRFSSPDPVQDGLANPQAWNRYAYALNRPTFVVDPNGLNADAGWHGVGQCFDAGYAAEYSTGCTAYFSWLLGSLSGGSYGFMGSSGGGGGGGDTATKPTTPTSPTNPAPDPDPTPDPTPNPNPNPSPPGPNPCNNRTAVEYVKLHLADAATAGEPIGVPGVNILGLSAAETGYGTNRFAVAANNFFSLHGGANAPYANGSVQAQHGPSLSTFPSFLASAQSFVVPYRAYVRGLSAPAAFVQGLIRAHFNTGNAATGGDPDFARNTVNVINMVHARSQCK
jgi:RHS repeat-associated protein